MENVNEEGLTVEYRNQKWGDSSKSWIECEIKSNLGEWIPFNAMSSDPMPYGREIFELISKEI